MITVKYIAHSSSLSFNSSCEPYSIIFFCVIYAILSQFLMVESLWAIMNDVLSFKRELSPFCTKSSVFVSIAEVASSSIRMNTAFTQINVSVTDV